MSHLEKNLIIISDVRIQIKENVCNYGNRFWIQLEDTEYDNNSCIKELVDSGEYMAQITITEKL